MRNGLEEDVLNKKMLYLMKVIHIVYVYVYTYIIIITCKNYPAKDYLHIIRHYLFRLTKITLPHLPMRTHADKLDVTIALLKHTSTMVELLSEKRVIYDVDDSRLQALLATLLFFSTWKEETTKEDQFISLKLWFDIQSMIHDDFFHDLFPWCRQS